MTDKTRTQRSTRRKGMLKDMLAAKGWLGISELLTAFLRGIIAIPPCPPEVIAKRKVKKS